MLLPSYTARNRAQAAFTLTELMVALTLFLLVAFGGISAHVFGLKMSKFAQARLLASHNARAALNYTRDEIRQATLLYVGNGNSAGFTNVAAKNAQQGNALQIYPTSDTNTYVRYFWEPTNSTLSRITSGSKIPQVIAKYVTNQTIFRAEDYAGNVLTNSQDNRVIKISLEFYQWEFATLNTRSPDFYDYYRLQTKVVRRQ